MDIQWLQRDFGIYVVNLFDTYHAAKLLGFAQLSLSFLLRHYCQVVVNKQYQLADWRIRPLPQEMVNYAREDVHYLIYIYEKMKQDLKTKGAGEDLLTAVWNNSRLVCLKRYRIPPITAESHLELYRRSKEIFNERQLHALKELFAWRNRVAREEDESNGFVLPNHMMLKMADVLPRETQGILACCSPVPPLVRQHLLHLHGIILKAREMPLQCHDDREDYQDDYFGHPFAMPTPLEQDAEDYLHCVHDLTHLDVRDDLPTLLTAGTIQSLASVSECGGVTIKDVPQARVFAETNENRIKISTAFDPPYARYMRKMTPMSAADVANRMERLRQHFLEEMSQNAEVTEESSKKEVPRPVAAAWEESPDEVATTSKMPRVEKRQLDGAKYLPKNPSPKKTREEEPEDNFELFQYPQGDYLAFSRDALDEDDECARRGRGRGRGGRAGYSNPRIYQRGRSRSLAHWSK